MGGSKVEMHGYQVVAETDRMEGCSTRVLKESKLIA